MPVEPHADLRDYFRARLTLARDRIGYEADPPTEYYLVELLARAAKGEGVSEEPLALAVADAAQAGDPRERFQLFRAAGDTALFRCGLFPQLLERLGLKRSYVSAMGRRAYGHAAALAHFSAEPFREVYPALGRDFDPICRVLADVIETPAPQTPGEILKLYRRWRTTGCERAAAALVKAGVTLVDEPRDAN